MAANRLAHEPSPYLQQHAADPVDWYPWGEEAFAAARELDRPVLLSIGYATCHWCHVMARESFRDPEVAALMNAEFVCVKVDREERPDVDAVYMAALQAMTGSGGWPLTMALTSAGEPFYGGTYFPPDERPGVPAFRRVLASLATAWRTRRADVVASAADLTAAVARLADTPAGAVEAPLGAVYGRALARLQRLEDRAHGGFGSEPKFPAHEATWLLLRSDDPEARAVALRALDAMSAGGIHDQLGGGFFRYAVDAAWRVPHFEKMLYDNAALLRAYALAARLTGEERYRRVAHGIVAWLKREMSAPAGGFYGALDAESEGEEGRYYLWTRADLAAALAGTDAKEVELAAAHYGIGGAGDFVPRVAASAEELAASAGLGVGEVSAALELARAALLAWRDGRVRPATDDKVLASWNGLAIRALASAGIDLADPEPIALAVAAADAVRAVAWVDGRLWHSWRGGELRVEGLLEDYAYLGLGLLELYRATLEARHLRWALELADSVSARFHDAAAGGYYSTAASLGGLIVRPKGLIDAATPSENTAAAELVWWAARYRDDAARQAEARAAVAGLVEAVEQAPQAFASSLGLLRLQAARAREVVLVGSGAGLGALAGAVGPDERRDLLVLALDGSDPTLASLPLAEGRLGALAGAALAYVCEGGACRLPVGAPEELAAELAGARS